ncbi:MAG: pyridoxal-phosphate dependent enzyme [Gemmatimonadales bacterium]|nr:pyridoxal-phosphate dependent enzyme [Gemmatimonadales bacterium]NIN12981.1 pyridoxal-phosphate dependent enzyme [Gemmatimonadales bacterium]NIN51058.1 pyridoxal-phosphate dependent enzyme [Gemmatimonadales bacterium]NIP08522.1 pyridoxal-phosphate dependent enzyme [Gemmatimonadales bacterium]NIR02240.1 pyridoxal-phosphate dependent enzyme [Gemmatimonadales bacterium]
MTAGAWPISLADVRAARQRIQPYLHPSALRQYAPLNAAVGRDIQVLVKHENHNPTNAFKIRNGLSALTALSPQERRRGVISATRGNHGQGLAYAGELLGIPVTICVPRGNNPEKNEAMRGFGAELIEEGNDYDDALAIAQRLVAERGMTLVHATNNRSILAGAGTITLEILEQAPELDAMVIAVGGGSQAVGALTVIRELRPAAKVYAVQAEGAPAIYQSWKARRPLTTPSADTFADGVATRSSYEMTFPTLVAGLADFVIASDAEIAEALRLLLRTTHNLVEGAGAAGLAGLLKLRDQLAGQRVAIILSGGNIDELTLKRVMAGEI